MRLIFIDSNLQVFKYNDHELDKSRYVDKEAYYNVKEFKDRPLKQVPYKPY